MISIILSFIFTAQASVYTPVLSVTELSKRMETELQTLQRLATKLSDKALMSEIEHQRGGREDFALVNFLGVPMIPMSLEYIARRGNTVNETHKPFIKLWEDDIWTYVLLNEYRERMRRR